jgi:hypothetical protein
MISKTVNASSVASSRFVAGPPEKRTNYFVLITAATAALAGLLFGFDTGVISGALALGVLKCLYEIRKEMH